MQLNYTVANPLVLDAASLNGSGRFQFRLSGQPGGTFSIQGSSTLANWLTLLTTNSTSGVVEFVDTNSLVLERRFYRALQQWAPAPDPIQPTVITFRARFIT